MRGLVFILGVLGLAAGLIALNVRPFQRATPVIRVKDLSFLPSPEVVRFLAPGHRNSAQRLRWIDSFAYLQLQFDRRNDTVAGGSSGFTRLYDGLLALDERFVPVYHQAAMSLAGVVDHPHQALSYLLHGTMVIPEDFSLWQHAASILVTNMHAEESQPEMFDAFLTQWAAAMPDEGYRDTVFIWRRAMANRRFRGLDLFAHWQDRLVTTVPGTPMSEFIEGIMRVELVTYARSVVEAIAAARAEEGATIEGLAECLDGALLSRIGPNAEWGPFIGVDGQPAWRSDPWGYPYAWEEGALVSPGLDLHDLRQRVAGVNDQIRARARERGHWPASLGDVVEWGIVLPELEAGQSLVYQQQRVELVVPPPPHDPWPLRPSTR